MRLYVIVEQEAEEEWCCQAAAVKSFGEGYNYQFILSKKNLVRERRNFRNISITVDAPGWPAVETMNDL